MSTMTNLVLVFTDQILSLERAWYLFQSVKQVNITAQTNICIKYCFFPVPQQTTKTKYQWWRSASTINLGSSVDIFTEEPNEQLKVYNELSIKKNLPPFYKRLINEIVNIFDLTLLKDPVYCNILLGLSLAVFAEVDFTVSTAFILTDFGLDTSDIAEYLSIQAGADIVFRFLSPYIEELFNQPPRIMYLFSLICIIITRFCELNPFRSNSNLIYTV